MTLSAYSRTMRLDDYQHLKDEVAFMEEVKSSIQMWYPAQHVHRHWEYALAYKVFKEVFGDKKGLIVSDHGCGAGFLGPMMYWLGQHVWLYECWTMGSAEQYMLEQMRRVGLNRKEKMGTYELRTRPLCNLTEEDRGVDAAFCISTLEHIGDYKEAFRDLLRTVKMGGLVGITTDFAEDEEDHYQYAGLRAGRMFNDKIYWELLEIGQSFGFDALKFATDWGWNDKCRLVNDYGFASLFMVKTE